MTSLSNDILDCMGFRRSDVLPLLVEAGIAVGDAEVIPPQRPDWPDWKLRLAVADYLTDREVAAALAGVDLSAPGWLSADEQAELSDWEMIVKRACDSGSMKAACADIDDRGSPNAWSVSFPDLAAWCASRNPPIPYPLPGDPAIAMPTTDAGLREALTAAGHELGQARSRIAELEQERGELLKQIESGTAPPAWTLHSTRLFRLLPAWIEAAKADGGWTKQSPLIDEMMKKHGLTQAEAKALDAVTRPDNLRGK